MGETPFAGSWLKLGRALEHFNEMARRFNEYVLSDPAKGDGTVSAAPPVLSAILGDYVHNLRSALDLAVCEVMRRHNLPDNNTQFPFANDIQHFDQVAKSNGLNKVNPLILGHIKGLQPFVPGDEKLVAVRELDNRDKHRAIVPVVSVPIVPTFIGFDVAGNPRVSIRPDHKGKTVLLFFPPGNLLAGREVFQAMHPLMQAVANAVSIIESTATINDLPGS